MKAENNIQRDKKRLQKILWFSDLILYAGLLIFALVLFRFMVDMSFCNPITAIADDTCGLGSLCILICTISVLQYCGCKDRLKTYFYAGVSVIGFLVLFINHNIISILIMISVFLLIPILFRPTAALVRRSTLLFFLYLFLLSNLSLLDSYTMLIQKKLSLNRMNGIFIDLFLLASGGYGIMYWEKIRHMADMDKLVLRKIRRIYIFVYKIMGIVCIGIIAGGEYWAGLEGGIAVMGFKGLALSVWEELGRSKGIIYLCVEHMGMIGCLLLLVFTSFILTRLRKNYCFDKPFTILFLIISYTFLIQIALWKPYPPTLPAYLLFTVLAAFYKEDRRKVSSRKVRKEWLTK